MNAPKRLCVFCGSAMPESERFRAAAIELGALIGRVGIELVYGGGRIGLMGLLADAALAAGGRVVGVIPITLHDREVAHRGLSELVVVSDMQERKRRMFELADAVVRADLDPRVHVSGAALRGQFALAQEVDFTLGRAAAAHREISNLLQAKPTGLTDALADSLRVIADGGTPSLASVAGVLGSLATMMVEADAAPNQGEHGVLREYTRQLNALLSRYRAVRARIGR